jgi:hypothetical protein
MSEKGAFDYDDGPIELRRAPGTCCPDNPNCEHEYKRRMNEAEANCKKLRSKMNEIKKEVKAVFDDIDNADIDLQSFAEAVEEIVDEALSETKTRG